MNKKKLFKEGLITNNPVLVQLVGLCSALALSASVKTALGMGVSVTLVLIGSNLVVSLLRNFIPNEVRIPAFIVIIASFVTILEMCLEAFIPELYKSMGVFLSLIVVNCIILARAESFASKNKLSDSILDGLANGLGYTLALLITSIVRELFGSGSLMGLRIIPEKFTIGFLTSPAAAFICLGCLMALMRHILNKKKDKEVGNA